MSKNIIFIPNIDCGDGRSTPYHYSVKSYKNWAKRNVFINNLRIGVTNTKIHKKQIRSI